MDFDNYDAVINWLWTRTQGGTWFKPSEETVTAGICLRIEKDHFRVFPYDNQFLAPFEAAVRVINPLVAIKIRNAAVHAAFYTVTDESDAIFVDADTRIQVLDTMSHLAAAEKEQCAAFLRDERVMVVWSDTLDDIIPLCRDLNSKLMKLVWKHRGVIESMSVTGTPTTSLSPSTTASEVNLLHKARQASFVAKETAEAAAAALAKTEQAQKPAPSRRWWNLFGRQTTPEDDPEKGNAPATRPVRFHAAVHTGLATALAIYFMGAGISIILQESRMDGDWKRFGLLAVAPFLFCVSLFFALQIISSLSFILAPISQYHENSKYYSAEAPRPNPEVDTRLPHVTIELPVYKESLEETITPSVVSLKKAMQTYARQGGTSAIFVHDDGLQLISEEERKKRIAFYADHNIGWVARPGHSNDADGFKRAGRFKKASNMNYGLQLSLRMEKKLAELESDEKKGIYHEDDGKTCLEDIALEMAVDEIYEENGRKWKPWACNGKSIRMGEIVLIVDSDTIVPEDCFRDAAREFYESPEVAIIQHESDVMQVAHHYFENGITHFTRQINKAISMSCANGEVAPFVGHNAFLRWSAIQDAKFVDPADGVSKCWSETNVSEDFDMALRLQLKGYIIRWATYSKGDFQEGVSLTVEDELNRWQKYSYGCNELMFNPLIEWWYKGPITKQLRTFIWSSAPIHYKISMMSYMFSYYGIAGAATLGILNYFLLGLMMDVDGYYMHSFEIWLACTVVFPGLGNVAYTILGYRLGKKDLLSSFVENMKWVPFFFFFFGGLPIHLNTAIFAHLFSYNITWGATKKEVERSNFFQEVPRIWKRFWPVMIFCILATATMIVLALPFVPEDWRIGISSWGVILPLAIMCTCHFLFPIVLNPWLLLFSY